MAAVVYALCALTSLACAALLVRGYRRTHARLLLWSGVCFAAFFVNSAILLFSAGFPPAQDLSVIRSLPLVVGVGALVYGLVWESRG